MMPDLSNITDGELRAEARRRGYELHSLQFSQAAQQLIRELPGLRRRLQELEQIAAAVAAAAPSVVGRLGPS